MDVTVKRHSGHTTWGCIPKVCRTRADSRQRVINECLDPMRTLSSAEHAPVGVSMPAFVSARQRVAGSRERGAVGIVTGAPRS